jgi:hypothetical protein
MRRAVREPCFLKIVEHELIDFFNVVAEWDEDACSYSFSILRDGLRLDISLYPYSGEVYVDVYRDGVSDPVIRCENQGCTHSRIIVRGSYRWLEIGRPEHPVSDMGIEPVLVWGVRVRVDPHISMEFIHEFA